MYKLLIVDDNAIHIQSVLDYVNWIDYGVDKIKTASNGLQGLELFKSFEPDLIITDIVMPVMDGLEMVSEIRKVSSKVKIVFISCYEEFDYIKKAIDNDATSFVLKPLQPKELNEMAAKLLKEADKTRSLDISDKLIKESLSTLRESFFYRILCLKQRKDEDFACTCENLGLNQFKQFIVVRIRDCDCSTGEDGLIDAYTVYGIIKNKLALNFSGEVFMESTTEFVAVLMTVSDDSDAFTNEVSLFVKAVFAELLPKQHIVVGVSKCACSLIEIHALNDQTIFALENNADSGESELYYYDDEYFNTAELNISELKQDLEEFVKKPTNDEIERFLNTYYKKNTPMAKIYVKTFCYSVVVIIKLIFIEQQLDLEDSVDVLQMLNKINNFDSILDSRQWIFNVLTNVKEVMENLSTNDRSKQLFYSIKDYINKNFMNISSVSQITSNVFISASYARALFKKYEGITVLEYITAQRMNEAKRLLQKGDIKVYDICRAVGYSEKKYFVKLFKKHTGMTPSEFQERYNADR